MESNESESETEEEDTNENDTIVGANPKGLPSESLRVRPDTQPSVRSNKQPNIYPEEIFSDKPLKEDIKEFIILVPSSACRQDLVDLKTYLESIESGSIQVFIEIQGQKKDTKISVESIGAIEKWTQAKGW